MREGWAACACERWGAACAGEEGDGGGKRVKKNTKTAELLFDIDILGQLEESKKKVTKVRDFEDLAKELGI